MYDFFFSKCNSKVLFTPWCIVIDKFSRMSNMKVNDSIASCQSHASYIKDINFSRTKAKTADANKRLNVYHLRPISDLRFFTLLDNKVLLDPSLRVCKVAADLLTH